ncbi:PAS domain S-box-containing protein [Salinibacter ruber]|uniref:sensor histidine kinase n=1 Tax=Salinibacter ruber TaxID=146919 RepID=UPI000E56B8FE|nr:PAS domain S-box protein [Salinibacter ruber]MCS3671273.1 PAS domain S-box-containing protein [Salinibacter ruber]
MSNASSPGSEQDAEAPIFKMDEMEEQLDVLRRHDVFEGRLEGAFDRMTRVAADLFDAEAAFVVFLNSSQQWLEDHVGLGRSACRAVAAWCTRVVEEDTPLVVDRTRTDTASDAQTQEGEPDFYAGVPVHVSAGTCIGVCAIVDSIPRSFSDSQTRRLGDVGQMISEKLEQRRQASSKRRLARERKEMSHRFQAILEDPNMMVGALDVDGTLVDANETALRYIEEDRESVVGRPIWETPWWGEEDRDTVRQWVQRAADGEYVTYEATSTDAQGRFYQVEGTIRPVTGREEKGDERVEALVVSARDVTERERSRETLELYREYTDRLLDDIDDVFFVLDETARPQRWNQRVSEVTGYSDAEIVAMSALDFVPESERARLAGKIDEALSADNLQIEIPFLRKDGTTVLYEFVGGSLEHPEGGRRIAAIGRDISERKKRERRLRQTETLFQNAQQPLFLLDVHEEGERFRLRRVNPAYEEKFERTAESVRGRSPRDIYGAKFGGFMEEKRAECVRRGEALQYEEKIPLDGAITYWKTRIAPVMGAGDVQQIVGHATNVTDQKRRERTLRERQDKIEALYKTADRLIRAPSKETVGTVLVRLIRTALGYQAVAVRFVQDENLVVTEVSETNFEFMPERPDFRVDGDSPIAEVYRSGQTLVIGDVEEDIDDEDDRVFPPNYYGNPGSGVVVPVGRHGTLAVASQEPQAIGPFDRHLIEVLGSYAAVVLDRLGHGQSLRERQGKVEALYEATQRLLTAEELESVSTRIHELLEDIFDYPLQNTGFVDGESIVPDQTSAKHAVGVPPPERRSTDGDSLSAQALRAGDTVVVDDAGSLDNDVEYGALRTAAAVPIGEWGVVVIGKTEVEAFDPFNLRLIEVLSGYAALVLNRLDREATLRDAKEEAEEASRMKSALLANMSHEIRTPLTSIIGFAEVVGTEASTLDLPTGSPLPDCADRIERGGKRLLDTLEGVLNLSKLEAGQMELDAEPVPLISEVQRVAEELQPKAREKEIDLRLETESAWAEADEGGVQIIARNLLSNAIKYTEADGTVWVRSYRADGRAVLEVEDTGIGMAPEAVDDLFEPFRQASEGFSREYEGTGVGLAVTKRAAEEMDGSVDVDTEEGEGSRFTVRLPTAGGGEASENGERTP